MIPTENLKFFTRFSPFLWICIEILSLPPGKTAHKSAYCASLLAAAFSVSLPLDLSWLRIGDASRRKRIRLLGIPPLHFPSFPDHGHTSPHLSISLKSIVLFLLLCNIPNSPVKIFYPKTAASLSLSLFLFTSWSSYSHWKVAWNAWSTSVSLHSAWSLCPSLLSCLYISLWTLLRWVSYFTQLF